MLMESVATYKFFRILTNSFFIGFSVLIIWSYFQGREEGLSVIVHLFQFLIFGTLFHLVFSHDINKYSNWIKQAKEFPREGVGEVSHVSQSSTKVNGRNLSVLSVKYKDFEVSFSGCDPDFAFKYRVGDAINIKVHETDDQRFVPAEFAKMK